MTAPYGGETPLAYQDGKLTVEPPAGTSLTQPILPGQIYALDIGAGYKIKAATEDDTVSSTVLVQALSRHTTMEQMGVIILSPYAGMVRRLPYKAEPSIGDSVEISSDLTTVDPLTWARGCGTVVAVDTANKEVEVFFG